MLKEVFKPVVGWENLYEVSDLGTIRSLPRNNFKLTTILSQQVSKRGGYPVVTLKNKGIKKTVRVGRIVAIAHIPNPLNLPEVNHKFGNKLDSRAVSLEWATRAQNVQHSFDTGLNKANKTATAKRVIATELSTGIQKEFQSIREAGRQLKIHCQNICAVLKGKYKKTNGYCFEYQQKLKAA